MMFRRKKDPDLTPRETLFFAVDAPAHNLSETLSECTDPHERAALLKALGHIHEAMAAVHRITLGPDPLEDENGRDLADSLWWSGHLLLKMADAEYAYAHRQARWKTRRRRQQSPIEREGGRWLDMLANRRQDRPSSIALDELRHAVVSVIGPQAAEVVSEDLYGPQPDLGTQQQYKAVA